MKEHLADTKKSRSGLSGYQLKLIACISMVIDHIAFLFISPKAIDGIMGENPWYLLGRSLGRPAFIILAFLLVEGFFRSENRQRYFIRIFVTALISEPIFDYMGGDLNINHFLDLQNVLFQFLLGIGSMIILETVKLKYFYSSKIVYNVYSVIMCMLSITAAYFLKLDYSIVGISLILIFYFVHGAKKSTMVLMVIAWAIGCLFVSYMLEWAGLPALILICNYNGEKGKDLKWFFYIFYPLHMLILTIAHNLIV